MWLHALTLFGNVLWQTGHSSLGVGGCRLRSRATVIPPGPVIFLFLLSTACLRASFLLMPALVVVAAVLIAIQFLKSRQTRPPRKPPVVIARVPVTPAAPETITPVIETFGNTRSFLTTNVASQVGGEILRIAPDFRAGKSDASDALGHGTPLAGIIRAVDDNDGLVGIAPNAKLHNLKVVQSKQKPLLKSQKVLHTTLY